MVSRPLLHELLIAQDQNRKDRWIRANQAEHRLGLTLGVELLEQRLQLLRRRIVPEREVLSVPIAAQLGLEVSLIEPTQAAHQPMGWQNDQPFVICAVDQRQEEVG